MSRGYLTLCKVPLFQLGFEYLETVHFYFYTVLSILFMPSRSLLNLSSFANTQNSTFVNIYINIKNKIIKNYKKAVDIVLYGSLDFHQNLFSISTFVLWLNFIQPFFTRLLLMGFDVNSILFKVIAVCFSAIIEEWLKGYGCMWFFIPAIEFAMRMYAYNPDFIFVQVFVFFMHFIAFFFCPGIHVGYNFVVALYLQNYNITGCLIMSFADAVKQEPQVEEIKENDDVIVLTPLPTLFPSIEKRKPPIFGRISFKDYKELYRFILQRPNTQGIRDEIFAEEVMDTVLNSHIEEKPFNQVFLHLSEFFENVESTTQNLYKHQIYAIIQFVVDCAHIIGISTFGVKAIEPTIYLLIRACQDAYAGFNEMPNLTVFRKLIINIKQLIIKAFEEMRGKKPLVQSHGDNAEMVDEFLEEGETIMKGRFATLIRDLFFVIMGLPFSHEASKQLKPLIGKVEKTSILDVVSLLLKLTRQICKSIALVDKYKLPLRTVLIGATSLDSISYRLDQLLSKQVYVGIKTNDLGISLHKFEEELKECKFALDCAFPNDEERKQISVLKQKILKAEYVIFPLKNDKRPVPIAFVLIGPPGIGKGTIINIFTEICCNLLDITYHPSQCYTKNMADKFFSGYSGQAVCRFPEVGALNKNIAAAMGDPAMNQLLNMIDNNPWCTEQSAVENKGRIFFTSQMVLVDTNIEDLNAQWVVNNPSAVHRRFYFVKATVKEQYCKRRKIDDGNGNITESLTAEIDPTIPTPPGEFYNKWNFSLIKKDAITNTTSVETEIFKTSDIKEFYRFISDLCKTHFEHQFSVLEQSRVETIKLGESVRSESVPIVQGNVNVANMLPPKDKKVYEVARDVLNEGGAESAFMHLLVESAKKGNIEEEKLHCFIKDISEAHYGEDGKINSRAFYTQDNVTVWDDVDRNFGDFETHSEDHTSWYDKISIEIGDKVSTIPGPLLKFAGAISILGMISAIIGLSVSLRKVTKIKAEAQTYPAATTTLKNNLSLMRSIESEVGSAPLLIGARLKHNDYDIEGRTALHMRHIYNDDEFTRNVNFQPTYLVAFKLNIRNVMAVSEEKTEGLNIQDHWFQSSDPIRGFGVFSNVFCLNAHSLSVLLPKGKGILAFMKGNSAVNVVQVDESNCVYVQGKDLAFIVHKSLQFRDIRNLIPDSVKDGLGYLLDPKDDIDRVCTMKTLTEPVLAANNYTNTTPFLSGKDMIFYNGCKKATFKSDFSGYNGLCGSPYFYTFGEGYCLAGIHSVGYIGGNETILTTVLSSDLPTSHPLLCRMTLPQNIPISMDYSTIKTTFDLPESLHTFFVLGKAMDEKIVIQHPTVYMIPTLIKELDRILEADFQIDFNGKQTFKLQKPIFKPYRNSKMEIKHPHAAFLEKFKVRGFLHQGFMLELKDKFFPIMEEMCLSKNKTLKPLSLMDALNGSLDSFCRRMKTSTAAGPMYPGGKSKYMPLQEDIDLGDIDNMVQYYNDYYKLEPEDRLLTNDVLDRVLVLYTSYQDGKLCIPIHKAAMKDEPRDIEKLDKHSIRHFFVASLEFLIASRQFLKPFYVFMNNYNDIFQTALGVDPLSPDWKNMFEDLKDYTFDAGDIGGFDINTPSDITLMACDLIYHLLRSLGYNDQALKISEGVLIEMQHPHILVQSLLIYFPFLTISGGDGTTEFNCLKNLILQVVCFAIKCTSLGKKYYPNDNFCTDYDIKDFFKHFKLRLLGDDSLVIRKNIKEYDFSMHQDAMRVINMEYTSPTKTLEGADCDIWNAEFLKRKSTIHPELGFVSKLSKHALIKMMGYGIATDISKSQQLREKFIAFCWELAPHYEREQWELIKHEVLLLVSAYLNIPDEYIAEGLPSWDRIKERILGEPCIQDAIVQGPNPVRSHKSGNLQQVSMLQQSNKMEYLQTNSEEPTVSETTDQIHTSVATFGDVEPEKGIVLYKELSASIPDLTNFLEREVLVAQGTYAIGTYIKSTWNALDLWYTKMRSKLQYFSYFKYKNMDISISFSSSSFHYQHAIVSYMPYDSFNEVYLHAVSLIGIANYDQVQVTEVLNNYLSQQKHCNVVSLRDNCITTLSVPYYGVHPYLNLFQLNTDANGTTVTPASIAQIGQVHLVSLGPVAVASSATTAPVSYSLKVKLSGVELGFPTAYTLQSGDGAIPNKPIISIDDKIAKLSQYSQDSTQFRNLLYSIIRRSKQLNKPIVQSEFSKGPISKLATSAASVAKAAEPIFGRFAKATEIGSNAVAKIADLFGFSRPLNLHDLLYTKNLIYGSDACELTETALPLALDPKRELRLGLDIVNCEEDEMSFEALGERITYLNTVEWEAADAVQAQLFNIRCGLVGTHAQNSTASMQVIQPTPAKFISTCFGYYHYDEMIFNLAISSTPFHAGKLGIRFQPPGGTSTGLQSTNFDYLTQGGIEWDVAEKTHLTFSIPWASSLPFLEIDNDYSYGKVDYSDSSTVTAFTYGWPGTLQIKVINTLVDPGTNGVYIHIFVSYKGLKFFKPSDDAMRYSTAVQTGITMFDKPIALLPSSIMPKTLMTDYGGEDVRSFKQLFSRYTLEDMVPLNDMDEPNKYYIYTVSKPGLYPWDARAPSNVVSTVQRGARNCMSHVSKCYLMQRGGVRRKFVLHGAVERRHPNIKVRLNNRVPSTNGTVSNSNTPQKVINQGGTNSTDWYGMTSTLVGGQTFLPGTGAEVEMPYYANVLYDIAFTSSQNISSWVSIEKSGWSVNLGVYGDPGIPNNCAFMEVLTAGATDYMLAWWTGPTLISSKTYTLA